MATQEDTKCNGWTNYETWTVNLFVSNESNECIIEATRAALRDNRGDALKDFVEEYFLVDPETDRICGGNLFIMQMVGAAMAEVNWKELRDHYVADADDWMELGSEDDDSEDNE